MLEALRSLSFSALLLLSCRETIYNAHLACREVSHYLVSAAEWHFTIKKLRNGSNSARPFNSARLNARSGETHYSRFNGRVITTTYRQPSGNHVRFAAYKASHLDTAKSAAQFLRNTVFSLLSDRKKGAAVDNAFAF